MSQIKYKNNACALPQKAQLCKGDADHKNNFLYTNA